MKIIIIKPGRYSEMLITNEDLSEVRWESLNTSSEGLLQLIINNGGVPEITKDIVVFIESTFPRGKKVLPYASMMRDAGFIAGMCYTLDVRGGIISGMEWRKHFKIESYFTKEIEDKFKEVIFPATCDIEIDKVELHNRKVLLMMWMYLKQMNCFDDYHIKEFDVYNTNLIQ